MKKIFALLLAILVVSSFSITAFAAPVDEATIDTTRTGSLDIYKYDLTNAEKDGVWDSSYVSTGVKDANGVEAVLGDPNRVSPLNANGNAYGYCIKGVEFTYVRVASIRTFTESENGAEHIEVLYGIAPTEQYNAFLSAIGVRTEDRYAPADEVVDGMTVYYYRSDVLIDGLKASLDANSIANALQMADVESPIDLEHISLALQGYNYGPGYISWALANYGGYSELNAIEFSDMMAAQYGWAGYGDKAYVSHVLRYYPIGRSFMGEGNAAMVAVAQSQIGNVGGAPYWSWWGLDYRVEWCAIFVSWCADQCGYLDAGVLPKMEGVRPYVDWFIERGQWQGREYEPSPGDIFFFDWESDGQADHVGIVEKVENGMIYTVEGNSGDRCIENRYYLGSAPVYGFGLPLY